MHNIHITCIDTYKCTTYIAEGDLELYTMKHAYSTLFIIHCTCVCIHVTIHLAYVLAVNYLTIKVIEIDKNINFQQLLQQHG